MVKLSRTSFSFFGLATAGFLSAPSGITDLEKSALDDADFGKATLLDTVFGVAFLVEAALAAALGAVALGAANFGAATVALVFGAGAGLTGAFLTAACLRAGRGDAVVSPAGLIVGFRARFTGAAWCLTAGAGNTDIVGCVA